jgi:hypothetical protein
MLMPQRKPGHLTERRSFLFLPLLLLSYRYTGGEAETAAPPEVDWDSVIADLEAKTPAQLRKIAKDMNLKVTTWNAKHLRNIIQETLQVLFLCCANVPYMSRLLIRTA